MILRQIRVGVYSVSEMSFAEVGGVTLHYSRDGVETGTPLVFINSLGTDLRLWDKLIPHFADHFALLRCDKRGHGLSDCPPASYTIRDHADDLANLLAALDIHEAVLIGISVGGLIALDFTIRHPQSVRALVLCDTGGKIGTADHWSERIEAVRTHGLDALADTLITRWFAPQYAADHPAEYRGYRNMLARCPAVGYSATCAALRDADLRASLPLIDAKALVLCGSEDVSTPPQLGRELAAALPNARFELIENAGHLPCVEQPDVMAAKIERFLEENGYGG